MNKGLAASNVSPRTLHGSLEPSPDFDGASLICFSHLRWNFVWQRPQHLLTRAARTFRTIFFEEPEYQPGVTPHLDIRETPEGIRVAVPMLPYGLTETEALAAQRRLLDRMLAGEPTDMRVFWYYTPMAMSFSSHLRADMCIYDNMDELSAFRGASPEMMANEDALFTRADLVFTGGMSLYEAKRDRHPRVHAFPSSIEFDHFAAARRATAAEPGDQAGIPGPRLGFFGVIDERMDLGLVDRMAELRPDWQFVMIGPVMKIDSGSLPHRPNIHWLGQKNYTELPAYLAGWDVGLMPFALNESTRFISPTKTPEFLAAGVPVVSTAIADVIRPYGEKGLVEIAGSAEEAVAKAETLMAATGQRSEWLARVDRHLAAGSWDETWRQMQSLIGRGMSKPRSATASRRGHLDALSLSAAE
jgi:hypothetical protein